jgi:hypothetical protein
VARQAQIGFAQKSKSRKHEGTKARKGRQKKQGLMAFFFFAFSFFRAFVIEFFCKGCADQ